MFCGKCGTKLEPGDQFCPNCGEPRYESEPQGDLSDPSAFAGGPPCVNGGERTWILDPPEIGGRIPANSTEDDGWIAEDDPWDGAEWADSVTEEVQTGSPKPIDEPLKPKPTMDPTERHELVLLTRSEAISGCQKIIKIDGNPLVIDIPPNFNAREKMIFRGYGYLDPATGERGVLKVQFLVN